MEDFTVESFVYLPQAWSTDSFLISGAGKDGFFFGMIPAGWGFGRAATAWDYISGVQSSVDVWEHIALTRMNSRIRMFRNGVQMGITQNYSYSVNFAIGGTTIASQGAAYYLRAYIDELQVIRGYARYTEDFVAPKPPYQRPPLELYLPNVTLVLHAEQSPIIDSSPFSVPITANGEAGFSNVLSKFGNGSIAFDGSGDSLFIATNSLFNFGLDDFTIEAWVNVKALSNDFFIVSGAVAGGFFFGWRGGWGFGRAAIAWDYLSQVSPTTGVWEHIAFTRFETQMRIFRNGVQIGVTTVYTNNVDFSVGGTNIGSQGASYYLNGNIDELRVTRGLARYTSSFTPPDSPFPNSLF
jgi:hypothetical protein